MSIWGCSAPEGGETLLRPFSTYRGPIRKMGTGFLAGPVAFYDFPTECRHQSRNWNKLNAKFNTTLKEIE